MTMTEQMVAKVVAAAKKVGRGSRKVFISDVASELGLELSAFKTWLTKVGCKAGVNLCRCDLVEVFPAEKVAASTTPAFVWATDPCAIWHFVVVN